METDRMAALGFSVLMREWRRRMAFDPWHGSLYLSLSAVITLFLLWIEKQTCTAGFDQLSQAHLTLSSTFAITKRPLISVTTCKYELIDHPAGKEKKRQKQICQNIILFAELHCEQPSQSSSSDFISYVCPNHTKALWLFEEVLL
ncbi:hypothetical protein AMECASPLE_018114 [Ameca splendens]|uniref:Uncharacterized protein n=1 Tax=Ameca splendens TaxID=208324 RepID=A0ABV0YQ33_9TELE